MNLETFKTVPYDCRHYFFQFLEKKDLEAFKLVSKKDYVFPYLDKKDLEAFKLCPTSSNFKYLDHKSLEAFKLMDDYGKAKNFCYLDNKSIEAFKLIGYFDCYKVFDYIDVETFKYLISNDIYYGLDKKITLEEFKKLDFNNDYCGNTRWWKFFFLDNKSIEAFKLIPTKDRYKAFKFLDNRNKQAFELIPPEDREKAFQY